METQSIKTEYQDTKTVSGVELLDIQISRNSESGLKIRIQSKESLWKFLRYSNDLDTHYCMIGGMAIVPVCREL